ncbi:MAG: efflux transporter periplasmic adaptor subunit [Bacteroidetes bacterium B1(2017)]|nr:MAG: efflux transporter periplasmic adaptor subunit [Bacteroidetes bacterium B1(2017)]
MKNIVRIGFFALLGILFVYTIWFLYKKSEQKPIVYNTISMLKTNVIQKTVATGAVVPRKEVNIKPQVSGIVEKLFVVAGDKIHKGDMIARIRIIPNMINLANAESRINRAQLAFESAKIDYERNQKLFDAKMIAYAEFQQVKLAFNNSKEELDAAQNNMQLIKEGVSKNSGKATNTIVKSTIDGMVLDVPLKEGSSVIESNTFNEGTTIATVADMGEMIFEGKVDESEVGKIKPGMDLILTVGAIDADKFGAKLEYIAPKGIKENGAIQFQIKAKVELQKNTFLRAGYSATADIVLARKDSVWSIPESVLQFDKDVPFVEVETKPQTFEKRSIKTGLSDGISIEILNGLNPADKIKDPNIASENAPQK